jgi:hypothetical protein
MGGLGEVVHRPTSGYLWPSKCQFQDRKDGGGAQCGRGSGGG